MAAKQLLPAFAAYIKVEIDFTSNWNTTTPSYTDVTADVRFQDGISWDRGKDQAWDNLAPGSFSFSLNNRAGAYEPSTNTDMVGSRLCRIGMGTTTTTSAQFTGVIDSFSGADPASGKDQIVQVSGVDWLTSLWLSKVVTFNALGITSTSTYQAICNAANIPATYQSFTSGSFTMKPMSFINTDCLSALGNVSNSQRQFLYVSKTGVITSVDLASGSVTQTYDDTSSTYPYTDRTWNVGGSGTYTVVELAQPGSIQVQNGTNNNPVTANVPGSPLPKTKFGPQVLQLNAAPVTNPTSLVSSWAGAVPSPATYWWDTLTIKPLKAPATLVSAVLGHELGDRITVVRHPLQGGSVSKNMSIRSVKHSIQGGDWTVTFGLTNR